MLFFMTILREKPQIQMPNCRLYADGVKKELNVIKSFKKSLTLFKNK